MPRHPTAASYASSSSSDSTSRRGPVLRFILPSMGGLGAHRCQVFERLEMARLQREAVAVAERDPIN